MKVRRIGTIKTLKQYEKALLEDVFPKYLAKSKSRETPQVMLADMRMECHNPFFIACVVLDEGDKPIGFLMARTSLTLHGRQAVVDHFHAPNMRLCAKMLELVMDRFGTEDVLWITHRDPGAWIKFSEKQGHPVELYGWLLRTKRK